jgi:hypothetical protein
MVSTNLSIIPLSVDAGIQMWRQRCCQTLFQLSYCVASVDAPPFDLRFRQVVAEIIFRICSVLRAHCLIADGDIA